MTNSSYAPWKPNESAARRHWISLVVGDDEMKSVMQLPDDLLALMYEDICSYGPAANEVKEFVQRLNLFSSDYFVLSQSRAIRDAFEDPGFLTSKWEGFAHWVEDAEELLVLDVTLWNLLSMPSIRASDVPGLHVVLWLITGQYIFPANFLPAGSQYVSQANLLLRKMKLSRLDFGKRNHLPTSA